MIKFRYRLLPIAAFVSLSVLSPQVIAQQANVMPQQLITANWVQGNIAIPTRQNTPYLSRRLSLHLKNVTFGTVLAKITELTGVNFSYGKKFVRLNARVSLDTNNVTVADALNNICATAGAGWVAMEGNDVVITDKNTADSKSVTITGRVTDATTKEGLPGANVLLKGTSIGASTNLSGDYDILNVSPGRYMIRVTYIGYVTRSIPVTVGSDPTFLLNISLKPVGVQGKEVVVTAQAAGQRAAINQQISSTRIANVVSEQKIRELPDANAAEALGRLPGISIIRSGGEASKIVLNGLSENYATITLDGVRLSPTDADSRGIDLSTIPQAALSGIVVTNAVTSDMDGSAIAGNVNFVTKVAPDKPILQITGQGSYGQLSNSLAQYNFYGNYGQRFLHNLLGVQVFGDIEQRNRTSESYNVSYDQNLADNTDYQISDFTINYVPEIRRRRGGQLLLDFDTPDGGVIKFNGDYNNETRSQSTMSRDYPVESGGVSYTFTGQNMNTNILDLSLQGVNHVLGWQVNWTGSFVQSSSKSPYDYWMSFIEPSLLDSAGNVISGMNTVPIALRKGPFSALIPYAINNFNTAYLDRASSSPLNSLDFRRTASLDIKRDYKVAQDISGEFKFGGKYSLHYHTRNSSSVTAMYSNGVTLMNYVKLPDGSIQPKDFSSYGFGNLRQSGAGLILLNNFIGSSTREIFNRYLLNPVFDLGRVSAWYNMNIYGYNPNTGTAEYSVINPAAHSTDYNLKEAVSAAYVMNTFNFGTLATLITGVRYEHDNDLYHAFYSPTYLSMSSGPSSLLDTTAHHTEGALLPNVNLILRPFDFMNIRLAAYEGISRPDFNYRLPTFILAEANTVAGSVPGIDMGNTNLKNATAWNYWLNFQFFGSTIGLLSLSAFYKDIKNEVEVINWFQVFPGSTLPQQLGLTFPASYTPLKGSYGLTYPFNSPKPTQVWGFEIQHQINFYFLPGLLDGLTLTYNLSVIKDQTYAPFAKFLTDTVLTPGLPFPVVKTTTTLMNHLEPILGSPQLFGNVIVGYDIGGFSARLSFFAQANYNSSYSIDQRSNGIQDSFERYDLALKQKITKNISIGLDLNNLTNAAEGSSMLNVINGWTLPTYSVEYGRTADLWLRVTV